MPEPRGGGHTITTRVATCPHCLEAFTVPSGAAGTSRRYCSVACRRAASRAREKSRTPTHRTIVCRHCASEFSVEIGEESRRRLFCDRECAASARRSQKRARYADQQVVRVVVCDLCGLEFTTPNSTKKRHQVEAVACHVCGEVKTITAKNYLINAKLDRPFTCDATCSLLARHGSTIPRELVSDFKDQIGWAQRWRVTTGHKPTRGEFLAHFGAAPSTVPRPEALPFFAKEPDSRWEQIVALHIAEVWGLEPLRNRKPITPPAGRGRWQLDLWLPDLALGFEVQDFKTHSRVSDDEPGLHGRSKHGPTYHEMKRRLAAEQLGVTLVEIWQDDIETGRYRALVDQAVSGALATRPVTA